MNWGSSNIEMVLTIGLCIILWLVGSNFIFRKSSKRQSIRRTLFLLLALVGLALIVIKPNYSLELKPEVVHIITSSNSIDIPEPEKAFDNVHAFLSSDVLDITSEIHIHGIGLERSELKLLEGKKIVFHPANQISGIIDLRIPQITEREQFTISGLFQGDDVERIYTIGPDELINEGNIKDGGFQIRSVAPVAGSYLIQIHTILSSNDTIQEALPIEVAHEPTWQMLVLSSYPSFEINYLKNYWTSLGNGFALRSKISKEKFHTSFVNMPKRNLDVLTRRIIDRYDFIVTDAPTWNQLTQNEQSNIKRAVSNKGLALMIRPSDVAISPNNLTIPKWTESKEIKWTTPSDDVVLTQINIPSPWTTTKQQGYDIAKYRSSGLGHIAVIGIGNTFKLILADNEKSYQNLWSSIFSDLYRDFSPTARLLHDQWIWEDEKNTISILSNQEVDSPPVLNDSISIPYLQIPYLKGVTDLTIWPNRGYNRININESNAALKFYAYQKDSWPSVKQHQLRPINQRAAEASASLPIPEFREDKPISVFWWYALCLLGFGALWLDERLYG